MHHGGGGVKVFLSTALPLSIKVFLSTALPLSKSLTMGEKLVAIQIIRDILVKGKSQLSVTYYTNGPLSQTAWRHMDDP